MLVGVVDDKYGIDFRYKIGADFNERERNNSVVRYFMHEYVDFYYEVSYIFSERGRGYILDSVYHYEREGMYVNTPGVRARVEYPRHDVRNDVVVPHFFHLRTCD